MINIVLSCFGNFKFVSSSSLYFFPLFFLRPPTPSFVFGIRWIAAHIRRELVPSSVFDIHLVTDPLGPVSLVFLVPEAAIVRYVRMFPATFELGTVRAVLVDGLVAAASSTAITRLAAVTTAASGAPPVACLASIR